MKALIHVVLCLEQRWAYFTSIFSSRAALCKVNERGTFLSFLKTYFWMSLILHSLVVINNGTPFH
jgi:hypothetical protein